MNKGRIPDKPYDAPRVLSTKVSPQFHRRLRQIAATKDATVSAVIKAALDKYIEANSGG
jgi:predicted transcriptional regulator